MGPKLVPIFVPFILIDIPYWPSFHICSLSSLLSPNWSHFCPRSNPCPFMPSGHPPPSYQQATKDNKNDSGGGAFTDDLINFGGHDDVTTTVTVTNS